MASALHRRPCRWIRVRRSTTDHLESRADAMQCGGQSGWATAGDEQIDHVRLASAAFSTLIRVLSSAAFSTEKTRAVIHAVCTKGSAIPSATTAT